MFLSDSSEKLHNISDEIKILVVILLRVFEPYSWVSFWVSSRKITPLDDVNSFLFNAYSVSSKKVYAIRAPDHPPEPLDFTRSSGFFILINTLPKVNSETKRLHPRLHPTSSAFPTNYLQSHNQVSSIFFQDQVTPVYFLTTFKYRHC